MSSDPHWTTKVKEFGLEYIAVKLTYPDWSFAQIAKELKMSTTSARRMLIVSDHLYDPKIANAPSFSAAYESVDSYDRDWKAYIIDLHAQYTKTACLNPTWTLEDLAKFLNKSPRTIHRMLTVFKHLDDPKISHLPTLNKAYHEIATAKQDRTTETKNQITETINAMIPTEKPREPNL
jgi:AraC-like DNA-binding protein